MVTGGNKAAHALLINVIVGLSEHFAAQDRIADGRLGPSKSCALDMRCVSRGFSIFVIALLRHGLGGSIDINARILLHR